MIDLTDTTDVIAEPAKKKSLAERFPNADQRAIKRIQLELTASRRERQSSQAIKPIELVERRQSFGEAKLIGFLPVADDTEMGLFTAVANFFGQLEMRAAAAD